MRKIQAMRKVAVAVMIAQLPASAMAHPGHGPHTDGMAFLPHGGEGIVFVALLGMAIIAGLALKGRQRTSMVKVKNTMRRRGH